MFRVIEVTYSDELVELTSADGCEFPAVATVHVTEEDMTPYTERRDAGYYDTKPVKTPKAEKSTTTEKLSGLTQGKAKK